MLNTLVNTFVISVLLLVFFGCTEQPKPKKDKEQIVSTPDTVQKEIYTFPNENDSLIGLKFNVNDVIQNKTFLKNYSGKKVIANFIGKQITFNLDEDSIQLVPIHGNGLMNTIYLCYAQHRPLVLSPDIIWMTIAQGVSTHINKNFKKLEPKLFTAQKPKTIEVRNDSLEFGAKYWQQLIGSLSDSTRKYTQKDMYSFMAPKFSTTTQKIFTAYEANILYAYKKAFTYIGGAGCGIPYITITGTKEDWVKMKEKLILLDDIELGYWRKELEPLLDEFIALYDKKRNPLFWKNIYKEFHDYGEFAITGWIIKLFPYKEILTNGKEDEETGMYRLEHDFEKNEFLEGDKYLYSTLNMDDFPTYKSEAKIIFKNYYKNETTHMFLYSGIMAAKQYADGSLKPWVTWAICSEKEPKAKELVNSWNEIEHRDPDWTPKIYMNDSTMDVKASYPKSKNISYEKSLTEFKTDLQKLIGPKNNYMGDTLTFYILANGKPLLITEDKKLETKVQNWINTKGIRWIPAKKKLDKIMFSFTPKKPETLISVNSKIEILLDNK